MKYSEALEIVHSLAEQNQPDIGEAFGDQAVEAIINRQTEALDTLGDLIANQHEEIDDRFSAAPLIEVGIDDVRADPGLDPSAPQAAVRICLDLARGAMLDDADMAEEAARQELAVSTVENFIILHGDALDASLTTLKM